MRRKKKVEKEASADTEFSEGKSSEVVVSSPESELSQALVELPKTNSVTCQNSRCGKTFYEPLKLIDLANPSDEGSYVCPYCLSKIEISQPEQEIVPEPEPLAESLQEVAEQKEGKCPHFVGYLSKRPKNSPIPDFCLTCPQMMECALG